MSDPVNTQILKTFAVLITAANVDAVMPVHIGRSEAEPFEPGELPAVNLLIIDESVSARSRQGAAQGVKVLEHNTIQIVAQVITQGTAAAENDAREISAQIEAMVGLNPTLGGICTETLFVVGRQWLRDDGAAQHLARQNTLFQGGYRTWSGDPYTPA